MWSFNFIPSPSITGRVDTVNMHETGLHRFGYVQVRVPCRKAHFYHLRHSYRNIALNEWPIRMNVLADMLNDRWKKRLEVQFNRSLANQELVKSSTESFEDFDRCVMAITEEHFTMHVSRCMTPHVCFSKIPRYFFWRSQHNCPWYAYAQKTLRTKKFRKMDCVATAGDYKFSFSDGDFLIGLSSTKMVNSEENCEAPIPKYIDGNYFYLP